MFTRTLLVAGLLAFGPVLGLPDSAQAGRTEGAGAEAHQGMTGVVEAVHVATRRFQVGGRVFRVPLEVADFSRVSKNAMVTVFWKPGVEGPEVVALEFPADQ